MMSEEKVQEILLQAAVLEGDVEVPDGEVVISQAEEIGRSPGKGVRDSLASTETCLYIEIDILCCWRYHLNSKAVL